MIIQNFKFHNIQKTSQFQKNYFYLNKGLNCDTVSFSSKCNKKQIINHTKKGYEVGKQIYEKLGNTNSKENIIIFFKETSPNLEIKHQQELTEMGVNPKEYDAMYTFDLDEKHNISNQRLYLKLENNVLSEEDKLALAMDIAHEYTHYSQYNSEERINEFKQKYNNSPEYEGAKDAIAEYLFKDFDVDIKGKFVRFAFRKEDCDLEKNRARVREQTVTKQAMLSSVNLKNEAVMKNTINKIIDSQLISLIKEIKNSPQNYDKRLVKTINLISKDEKNYNKFKAELKEELKKKAKDEKEATKAECDLAKKIIKTSKSINYDATALYYELLENCFN